MVPDDAVCAVHSERRARNVCARCGAFACAACSVKTGETWWCAACSAKVSEEPPSRLARAARLTVRGGGALLVASWVGVFARFPALLAGVCLSLPVCALGGLLAIIELTSIANGTSPRSGKSMALRALLGAALVGVIGGGVSLAVIYQIFSSSS